MAPAPAPAGIELPALKGFKNAVNAMAFSPDGKSLVTTDFDHHVRLWDVATRSERAELAQGESYVSAAYSPDGRWIVVGAMDAKVRIWDTERFQLRTFTGHATQVIGLTFTPDSKLLASASTDGTVRLWDPLTGLLKMQLSGHPKGAMCVAISPNGKQLAAGAAELLIKLWEIPSGRELRKFETGPDISTVSLAFTPDGKSIVGGGNSGKVTAWEIDSGRARVIGTHPARIRAIVVAPDGRWLATAGQDALRFWDFNSGAIRATFPEEGGFFSLTTPRKGEILAGGSATWSVRIWDPATLAGLKPGPK